MTTWMCDPINGSDTNGGDSWAVELSASDGVTDGTTKFTSAAGGFTGKVNRWIAVAGYGGRYKIVAVVSDTWVTLDRTIAAGSGRSYKLGGPTATLAVLSTADGDEVHYPKTPDADAVSANNLTYTDQNATASFSSGRVKGIDDCESGWAAAANVTATHTATNRLVGSNLVTLAFASAFTTGKAGYKQIGGGSGVDFSAFQGISFGLRVTSGTLTASTLKICLCSDTTGDVIVDNFTIPLPANMATGGCVPFCIMRDGGGNLGASIQSIAVYAVADPGTPTVAFDNFMAVLSLANNDHLCHQCVLSQSSAFPGDWWGIQGFPSDTTLNFCQPFTGTGGSVASYRRHLTPCPHLIYGFYTTLSDPANQEIECIGGYNTASDTQDGVTAWILYPVNSSYSSLIILTNPGGVRIKSLLLAGGTSIYESTSRDYYRFENLVCTSAVMYVNWGGGAVSLNMGAGTDLGPNAWQFKNVWFVAWAYDPIYGANTQLVSSRNGQWDFRLEDIYLYTCAGLDLSGYVRLRAKNIVMKYHASSGAKGVIFNGPAQDIEINGLSVTNPGTYAIVCYYFVQKLRILGLATSGASTATIQVGPADVALYQPNCAEATRFDTMKKQGKLAQFDIGGVAGDHQIDNYYGTIYDESSIRHTASGISWKMCPTNSAHLPLKMRLGLVALKAGVEINISAWLRRSNTGLSGRLYVPGGQIDGVDTEQSASISAGADIFQQLTLTFTPTADGVVEVWTECWGGTTYSMYVDDLAAA